jgi:hypothetical protein
MMRAALAVLAALLPMPARADAPLSAIPWLTESIRTAPAGTLPAATGSDAAGTGIADIRMTALDAPQRDGAGLLRPSQTGFPAAIWGQSSPARARDLILGHQPRGLPETQALFRRLLLAQTEPPPGAGPEAAVLLARIDRLIQLGALDDADALIRQAGVTDPELFRRAFDIGLLTERPGRVCDMLRSSPSLSPTLPARVFCLARAGDWDAAALTLELGGGIGDIAPVQRDLLSRFLDPALFEDMPAPEPSDPMTPLEFVLRESVALPRPVRALPLAFLHADLADHAPPRTRILAAERLVRVAAIRADQLFATYRAGRPAASGSVWDHAAAIQAIDAALHAGDPDGIADALARADSLFSQLGLRLPFAQGIARKLATVPRDGFPDDRIDLPHTLLILAGDAAAARKWQRAALTPGDRLKVALAEGSGDLPASAALSELERAIVAGLTGAGPYSDDTRRIAAMFATEYAAGLLATLDLLAPGAEIDPRELERALWLLRQAGLEPAARRIALETLLLAEEA